VISDVWSQNTFSRWKIHYNLLGLVDYGDFTLVLLKAENSNITVVKGNLHSENLMGRVVVEYLKLFLFQLLIYPHHVLVFVLIPSVEVVS
jgi:hypothetical protein